MNERVSIVVTWMPARGPRRRVVFEPRNAGEGDRVTKEYRGDDWLPTGSEIVTGLEFTGEGSIIESNRGP